MPDHGVLAGIQLQPRELVQLSHDAGWQGDNLHTAVAIWFAESQGYTRAYNDNLDDTGKVVSRDVGVCQINIPAADIGTAVENDLYDPVFCLAQARKLFDARGFQPWVAFNSGVYTKPYYQARAALGIFNWTLAQTGIPVPVFSLKELRAKNLW